MGHQLTTEDFIVRSRSIHGDRFDYSCVEYVNNKTHVTIICSEHGEFDQLSANHMKGQGCAKCEYQSRKLSTPEFVTKAQSVHGEVYDYSNTIYNGYKHKVTIVCNVHGKFTQTATDHLSGSGCSDCSQQPHSKQEVEWLTSLNNENIQHVGNGGQVVIPGTKFKVDGFDATTNTVYEFYGDYWHGHPTKYTPSDNHPHLSGTFADVYQRTHAREQKLTQLGYNVVTMWECDYNNGVSV